MKSNVMRNLMNSVLNLIRNYWLLVTILFLSVITILSLYPLKNLPSVPGSDKTHHFIAYGALMFPTALRRPKYWQYIGLLFICWSGAIELIQPYVNRYGEWLDMAANTTGVICGLIIAFFINRVFPDKNRT